MAGGTVAKSGVPEDNLGPCGGRCMAGRTLTGIVLGWRIFVVAILAIVETRVVEGVNHPVRRYVAAGTLSVIMFERGILRMAGGALNHPGVIEVNLGPTIGRVTL